MIVRELVFWLVFCIAIGIFTVFIVSIISILLVIAELVLMMFPDLRVLWTITDNFLWEIEEDICQNEIKKKRIEETGLYQQKCWIQCRYF